MILETKGGYIEKYDINNLNEDDLNIFHSIERDTWAYFLGEYVKCKSNDCGTVLSKSDIYSLIDNDYKKKSVFELEQEYGKDICCSKCGSETDFLRGDSYKGDMFGNLTETMDSHIVCYRNKVGEICGFSQGYIDNLETIGNREFKYKFSPELLKKLEFLYDKLFITITSTCILEKNQDMGVVFDLLKFYFASIDNKYSDLDIISDGIVGSPTFNLYTRMGAQPFGLPEYGDKYYKNSIQGKKIVNDLFIHSNVVNDYREIYSMNFREVLKYTKGRDIKYWKGTKL